jgi:hypothetical protein
MKPSAVSVIATKIDELTTRIAGPPTAEQKCNKDVKIRKLKTGVMKTR